MKSAARTIQIIAGMGCLLPSALSGCITESGARTSSSPQEAQLLRFVDAQDPSGVKFVHSDGGSGRHFFVEQIGSGCAFIDIDNDDRLDVFAVSGSPLPGYKKADSPRARLWRNLGNGKFEDVTEKAGVGLKRYATGISAADYDNDGFTDLYVTCYGTNALLRNRGNGTFEDRTEKAGVGGDGLINVSSAFVDYDNNSHPDLYVCRYVGWKIEQDRWCGTRDLKKTYCGPEVYPARRDTLYRNRGDGTFEDVTVSSGAVFNRSKSLGVVPTDVNGDGWIDLYVANDLEANLLFINDAKGGFREQGVNYGVAFGPDGGAEAGMGVASGDFDNDLKTDLFVTNYSFEMYALYANTGRDLFRYDSLRTGIGPPTLVPLGFGTRFADFNNDGWSDIIIANGHVLDDARESHEALEYGQTMQLFINQQGQKYTDSSAESGPTFRQKHVGRGLATGDYDNDGRLDALVNNINGPLRLIHNESKVAGNWIGFRLVGKKANRSALGARVTIRTAEGSQMREVTSGSSYLSQSDLRLHFGLGKADSVTEMEVRWPGHAKAPGIIERYVGLKAGSYHTITEGQGQPSGG